MAELTPMLRQFFKIKNQYQDAILFFRMGDFYEMFFEDAIKAAPILNITLTSRSKHQDKKIPMCGVPYHAAEGYMAMLLKAGEKVAVCDQVEDPKARDPKASKGIVKREVTRVLTPGMPMSDIAEDPKESSYLAAITGSDEGRFGLAAIEISTGDFVVTELFKKESLKAELARLSPGETLISEEDSLGLKELLNNLSLYTTTIEASIFSENRARQRLNNHFGEHAFHGFGLSGFGPGIQAAGAALLYAEESQKRDLPHLNNIRTLSLDRFMVLDNSTRRNLELFESLAGRGKKDSLLNLMDQTNTAMGGRLMKEWLGQPLINRDQILTRHEAVETLALDGMRRSEIREIFSALYDLGRLTGRITLNRAGPREFSKLAESLKLLPKIKTLLSEIPSGRLKEIGAALDVMEDIKDLIDNSLVEEPPANTRNGGLFKKGYHPELDELIFISTEGKSWLAQMEKQEKEATGITNLKVGFNKVFGYFLEVSRSHLDKIPERYIRKQTLVGSERYITEELKIWETKVLTSEDRRISLEAELFESLRLDIVKEILRLKQTAEYIAETDCLSGLSEAAVKFDLVRPELTDDDVIEITGGRHPVIERNQGRDSFVPNDITLNNETDQILIITGPNMAGKSTILRQTALIALMNQVGSFVPAEKAKLGILDRIFTRIGASDDLARGRSTFMVEMNETAQILNQATNKSLVILDEIGRGTSTFDGLSIAWAVTEYLHDLKGRGVRTLFATHYHELVETAHTRDRVKNFNVAVKQYNKEIIFLRKLIKGGTSRSYGIAVARLAGLPEKVLKRAEEILQGLESKELDLAGVRDESGENQEALPQLSLFKSKDDRLRDDKLRLELKKIEPEIMTPLEAINKLAELKKLI